MAEFETTLGDEAPRNAVLPFLLSAPVAIACAGGVLLAKGEAPLVNNWSTLTMALTHIGTLGFLTMLMLAAFYVYAPGILGKRIKAPRLALLVYCLFAPGVIALCLGLGGVAVMPVFVAIGTLFPGLIAFFWPAIAALRGTRAVPFATPLRLAVGSFFAAATIGIWVAHGHGGMKFPGPRGLWLQLHLSIALLGWIGGMATACFGVISRAQHEPGQGTRSIAERWWGHLTLVGISASCLVLTFQYFGLTEPSPANTTLVGAIAAFPAAVAGFWLQPFVGLKRLRDRSRPVMDAQFWRGAFVIAPIASFAGLVAMVQPEPHWRIAFGWIALWGWAGLIAHAVMRDLSRRLLGGNANRESSGLDLSYALHVLTLLLGLMAIEWASAPLARVTGACLIVLALLQAARMVADHQSKPAPGS